jgi:hypothetical protein
MALYEARTGRSPADMSEDEFEFIYRCWTDFEFFLERIFYPYELHHVWTSETVESTKLFKFQRMLAGFLQDEVPVHQKVCIEAPTGSSKTDTLAKGYVLWRVGLDPIIRIGLYVHDKAKSQRHMSKFMSHFESNTGYRFVFGDMTDVEHQRHSIWGVNAISVKQLGGRGNVTITACTYGSESEGLPFDFIVCDDVIGRKEARTPEACDKAWMWFTEVVENRLRADTDNTDYGCILSIGTRQSAGDIHARLKEREDWYVKEYRAIMREAVPIDPTIGYRGLYELSKDENGRVFPRELRENWSVDPIVLLPERRGFRYGELCWERKQKPIQFARKKMNLVWDESAKLFSVDLLRNYCRADGTINPDGNWRPKLKAWEINEGRPAEYPIEFTRVILSVDLAATAKTSGRLDPDYFVILVLGVTEDHTRVVLDVIRMRTSDPSRQRAMLLKAYKAYRPTIPPIVEANACQRLWAKDVTGQTGLAVREEQLKGSKLDEIEAMADVAKAGKLLYPWDDEDTHTKYVMHTFEAEINAYPDAAHDDQMMALILAERHVRKGGEMLAGFVKAKNAPIKRVADAIDEIPIDPGGGEPDTDGKVHRKIHSGSRENPFSIGRVPQARWLR